MTERIIIYGNSKMTPVLTEYLERSGGKEIIGYSLHQKLIDKPTLYDRPLIPFETLAQEYPPTVFKLHILNDPSHNLSLHHLMETAQEARHQGFRLYTFIDPDAWVAESSVIGDNCCLFPGARVEPLAQLEDFVLLRPNAHVGISARVGCWSRLGIHAVVCDNHSLAPETSLPPMSVYGA